MTVEKSVQTVDISKHDWKSEPYRLDPNRGCFVVRVGMVCISIRHTVISMERFIQRPPIASRAYVIAVAVLSFRKRSARLNSRTRDRLKSAWIIRLEIK